jgi:hypothetical protein
MGGVARLPDEDRRTGGDVGEDENLEIVFWWAGEDHTAENSDIEDDFDAFLRSPSQPAARRRRLPWPGRRTRSA